MASVATAQTLPEPILDCIAHWLFPKSRGLAKYPLGYYRRTKSLVPFLGVCCAWRWTFARLYYHMVLLIVPNFGRPYMSYDGLPTLQDAVDRGCGMYVREIVIRLSSIDYNFVNTKQHQNPLHVVQSCGQFPSVRGLNFRVEPAQGYCFQGHYISYNSQRRLDSNIEPCEPGETADLFCSVVDLVMESMPNIRDVAVHGSNYNVHIYHPYFDSEEQIDNSDDGQIDDSDEEQTDNGDEELIGDNVYTGPAVVIDALKRIYDKVFSTISTRVARVAFSNKEAAEHLSFCPQIDSLTCITTRQTRDAPHVSELIRRNSGSLVRLDIDRSYGLDIALLLSSRINPGEMCVYPCLKELCARKALVTGLANLPQLLINPFPALEVLHCDVFPRCVVVIVLRKNRAHLRDVTANSFVVSEVIRENSAAEEGAFPCLIKLSLPLPNTGGRLDIYELLGHCPNLSVLKVHTTIAVAERPVPRNPLSKLQSLEISSTKCTVYQAAAIFCACPWLTKASIFIHRDLDNEDSSRSDEDIKAFLEKYRGHGLHLHSLRLMAVDYPHCCLICEDAVRLAALFPAINHVGMYGEFEVQHCDNIRYLQEELTRSAYKDIVHLKRVKFGAYY